MQQFFNSLSCDETGIYYTDSSENISYPDNGNDLCFEVEENSFWFRHRNDCIIEMIKNYRSSKDRPIFDVGGGNVYVAKGIKIAGFGFVGLSIGTLSLLLPAFGRVTYFAWHKLIYLIDQTIIWTTLPLFYYVIFCPYSLLIRLFGKSKLRERTHYV